MLTYRNEAAFSKSLVSAMRNKGYFVQRIESGTTARGIPDLFVIAGTTPMWIELKRVHDTCSGKQHVVIPWRPGQQAWLFEVAKRGVTTMTLACFDDGILQIPHNTVWNKNLVLTVACRYYKDIRSLLK